MRILLNVLLFLAITNLYAQNSIKGTVTDATTNQGIPYANIYLSELEKGTYTNENGDFLL
jgi:iron complex outermembrane receptor protein